MPIAQATSIVRIAPDSIVRMLINPTTTYNINIDQLKRNVKMGMIAIPSDEFPGRTKTYFHQEFSFGNNSFQWHATQEGVGFGVLYFYLLLPWQDGTLTHPAPHKRAFDIGMGDGEANDLPGNKVASLSVQLTATQTENLVGGVPGTSIPLPANLIEFVPGYVASIGPNMDNSTPLQWAEIHARNEVGHPSIELKARIHIISGADGNVIKGIIDSDHTNRYSLPLRAVNTVNNNDNLIALVVPTPTQNPDGSTTYTFEVGDPEKDGRVTISSV